MNQIEDIIKSRRWTQEGTTGFTQGSEQPRISGFLITGRLEKFTVDMLMKWLHKLGKESTTISVKDKQVA